MLLEFIEFPSELVKFISSLTCQVFITAFSRFVSQFLMSFATVKAVCSLNFAIVNYFISELLFVSSVGEMQRLFQAASHQKAWDHFTKAQRKSLESWKKHVMVRRIPPQ